MARPKDPNSKRSLIREKKEAKEKAKALEKELLEKEVAQKELQEILEAKEQAEAERLAELQALKEELAKKEEEALSQKNQARAKEVESKKLENIEVEENLDSTGSMTNIATKERTEPLFDPEDEDLMNLLNEAITDEKKPVGAEEEELEIPENYESDFEDDFEETESIEEYTEPSPELSETEDEKVHIGIPSDDMADIIVEGFDTLLQWGAPMAYKKQGFSKEDRKRLRQLAQSMRGKKDKEIVLDDYDLELLERFEEFEEYKEGVPLSKDEKKNLKTPLEILLRNRGGDLPPGWALAYAATMTMLPRISPILALQLTKQYSSYFENQSEHENATKDTQSEDSETPE